MAAAPWFAVLDAASDEAAADEGAMDEAATDAGATLLAGATEEAGLGALEPPPPPPQAVRDPLKSRPSKSLDVFIYRSQLLLIWSDINHLTGYMHLHIE
jgi:hypothetical protein